MEVARTRLEARETARGLRTSGSLALVPTMGAFHEGHLSLLRAARRAHGALVATIFVNPIQFGSAQDLAAYPRDEQRDLMLAEAEGVDLVFAPTDEEMYRAGDSTRVTPGPLASVLEGASRPGHFEGVATVVAKLFNILAPRAAFFGQKDAQQVAIVRRLVADLCFDVDIEVCETVREHDGLALSSRNVLLSEVQRTQAATLSRALEAGRRALDAGARPVAAEEAMREQVAMVPEIDLDYACVVDEATFDAPVMGRSALLLIAANLGRVRLIDNMRWAPCS